MQNSDLCRRLLETLLGFKIRELSFPETEKVLASNPDKMSVRLGVYVTDENGKVYDIEMQTSKPVDDNRLDLRTRYYQSMLDQTSIEKGGRYTDLRESFIIFICTFDPFKLGRRRYTFRNLCVEQTDLALKDRATRIFLNAKGVIGEESEEVQHFLNYVAGNAAEGALTRDIDAEVARIKQYDEIKAEYMTLSALLADERYEGKMEGLAEGKAEERFEVVSRMLSRGYSPEQISDILGILLDEVKSLAAKVKPSQ
ncbi:MAG: Rpn family recombination-promoting nuclease/putative transposase [Desulfovibrio sp.]|nr:Rpn family recombination-promoting nuclease/putative transposase [Desulfovibrio sp.]